MVVMVVYCFGYNIKKNRKEKKKVNKQFGNVLTDYSRLGRKEGKVELVVLDGEGKMRREEVDQSELLHSYKLCLSESSDYDLCY